MCVTDWILSFPITTQLLRNPTEYFPTLLTFGSNPVSRIAQISSSLLLMSLLQIGMHQKIYKDVKMLARENDNEKAYGKKVSGQES